MPVHDLKEQIARLPEQPGVYLWRNAAGDTIYVGKARALRDRVRSYLGAAGLSPRHDALLDEIASVEVVVTDSVMEALALENNLISSGRRNTTSCCATTRTTLTCKLTTSEAFPRVLVARAASTRGATSTPVRSSCGQAGAADHGAVASLVRHPLVQRSHYRHPARPCLELRHQAVSAPCVAEMFGGTVRRRGGQYQAASRRTEHELIATLRDRMAKAAGAERFEEAAQMRDALRTVQVLRDRQQKVATPALGDRDVFGLKVGPSGSALQVFAMRGGRVVERVELAADPGGVAQKDADVLEAAVQQFYEDRVAPAEIDLPLEIDDAEAIEAWLSARAGRRVHVLVPRRGDKRALVELATRNAELSYRTKFNEITAAHFDALETLRATLGLPAIPRRIECFDISTIQGSETVASMVVCEDGRMKKSVVPEVPVKGLPTP